MNDTQTVSSERKFANVGRDFVLLGGRLEIHLGWFSRWYHSGKPLVDLAGHGWHRHSYQRFYVHLRIWRVSASLVIWGF